MMMSVETGATRRTRTEPLQLFSAIMFTNTARNHFTVRGAPSDVIEWNPFTICAFEVRIVDGARRKRDRRKDWRSQRIERGVVSIQHFPHGFFIFG